MEFINSNSRMVQVSAYDGFVYMVAETGKVVSEPNGSFNNANRKVKLYKIDAGNGTSLATYVYDIPLYCGLTKLVDGSLYMFRASFSEDDFKVWMDKIPVPDKYSLE